MAQHAYAWLRQLLAHREKAALSFHTPGAKSGAWGRAPVEGSVDDLRALDLTELSDTDDLHAPQGALSVLQERAAALWGAKEALPLVNGATAGVAASVAWLANAVPSLTVGRNAHLSVLTGLLYADAMPHWQPVSYLTAFDVPLPPRPETNAFATYPTYEGIYPLPATLSSRPTALDAAHGALLRLLGAPLGGEAVTVMGAHKQLPSPTQTAWLLIEKKASALPPLVLLKAWLDLLQTTSPSALLLAGMEEAVEQLREDGLHILQRSAVEAEAFRREVATLDQVAVLLPQALPPGYGLDPFKLLVRVDRCGLTARQAASILERQGIFAEYAYGVNLLFSLTPADDAGTRWRLFHALGQLPRGDHRWSSLPQPPESELVMAPREAWLARKEIVPLQQAQGRVAATYVAPYPPGLPLLWPGEKMTSEIIEYLIRLKEVGAAFHAGVSQPFEAFAVVA
ncbi:MAG: hypothetical protein IMW91_04135 [Firmicutes bacterium]|nr:hypothetical protein [Bacillota bacterium]